MGHARLNKPPAQYSRRLSSFRPLTSSFVCCKCLTNETKFGVWVRKVSLVIGRAGQLLGGAEFIGTKMTGLANFL